VSDGRVSDGWVSDGRVSDGPASWRRASEEPVTGPGGLVVIGHSMGALLAPLVAARLDDRVRRVVLVDGGVAPERSLLIRRPVVRALFRTQMKIVGRPWRDAAAFVDRVEGRAIRNRPELRAPLIGWAEYGWQGRPAGCGLGWMPLGAPPMRWTR
jgi:pimeloyl-ACP methyl ester carboxylesterase